MTQFWSPVAAGKQVNDSLGLSSAGYEWYASHYGETRTLPYTYVSGGVTYNDCATIQKRYENGVYITAFKVAQGSNSGVNGHLDTPADPGMAVIKIHIR